MTNYPNFSNYGYQIIKELGHNRAGGRVTYLATEINTQKTVVVKQFQFATTGAHWSEYQAYEREVQVLKTLDHPNIPHYLDSFQTPSGFCMVQEYKNAISLANLATSQKWQPQQIKQIAISVLEILKYLQNRIPAVIHREQRRLVVVRRRRPVVVRLLVVVRLRLVVVLRRVLRVGRLVLRLVRRCRWRSRVLIG
ncbi:MAG: protein kinase [Okeania sp. SIO2B9]|nr:protein kinase [Okeania sp. SIO2B9]